MESFRSSCRVFALLYALGFSDRRVTGLICQVLLRERSISFFFLRDIFEYGTNFSISLILLSFFSVIPSSKQSTALLPILFAPDEAFFVLHTQVLD